MTRRLALAISLMALTACAVNLTPVRPSRPAPLAPALAASAGEDVPIPATRRLTLSNGMVVHLLPDHELPLINVSAMVKTGSVWEPADKAGLAALTGAALRAGGTAAMAPDDLDETLEFIAASVETWIGEDMGGAKLSALAKDMDLGLKLLADTLREPRFDAGRIEIVRAQMIDAVRRRNDDPTEAAERELTKFVFHGSPYGREPTEASLRAITRADIIGFYKNAFVPRNVMLGVTGDFNEETIAAKLEAVFGDWRGKEPVFPPAPAAQETPAGVWLARKDIPQTVIRAGLLAGKRSDPDFPAARVMESILGGAGFTSRLMKSVRVDRGLAYSAWAYLWGGAWERGKFMAGAETKAQSTAEVIRLTLAEFRRMRDELAGEEELAQAKNTLVNSFVFIFDRPEKILNQRMRVEYYGLPADYLETFRARVRAVTAEEARDAARKILRPENLKIVVVGDPEKFDAPLDEFGPVAPLSLEESAR